MKLISTVYAIRQKSTGHFLPMRFGSGRGYSFDNPTPDCVPRLFKSKNGASKALTAWLQGEWKDPVYDHDEWNNSDYVVAMSPIKIEGRSKEDMEIVELSLLDCSISELVSGGKIK